MALSEGLANITRGFRFHAAISGGKTWRLCYLLVYYGVFLLFRWGDRYSRPLRWLKRLGLSDKRVVVTMPDGVRISLDLHTAFDPLYQIYEARDYAVLDPFVPREGDVVLDLGANVGIYALWAAARVGPEGRVVAVEPHPGNFALLRSNAEANGFSWLTPVQAAAADAPGRARLYIHPRAINFSLVRTAEEFVDVEVLTVDGLAERLGLSRVAIVKVDVEGSEPAVLKGARGVLERHKPFVALERDALDTQTGEQFQGVRYVWRDISAIRYAVPRERESALSPLAQQAQLKAP